MDAFRSVRGALLQTIHSLLLLPSDAEMENRRIVKDGEEDGISVIETEQKNGFEVKETEKGTGTGTGTGDREMIGTHWHIYVTGHSLGGALATLFSFELGRMRAGASILFFLLLYYTALYYTILYSTIV